MTAADQKELGEYLRWIADRMGLRDWRFEMIVQETISTDGGLAGKDTTFITLGLCSPTPGQKKAWIYFAEELRNEKREVLREVVVHELVHCHLVDMYEFGRTGVLDELAQSAYNLFMFGFTQAWEHATDSIARAWAEEMPLIKWPTDKRKKVIR